MKKDAMIFAGVTVAALVAATLGHMYYPPFCMATKPMAWPFVALVVLVARRMLRQRK